MTPSTTISTYDLLLELIELASTVSDEQKREWIHELETRGLSPELQKTLIELFKHEAELIDQEIGNLEERLSSIEASANEEEERVAPKLDAVLKEHEEGIKSIESDIAVACARAEKDMYGTIESAKKKDESSQMDAIRAALKKKD
jgi:hypothetical protein